jgi:hypothetical protein
LFPGAVSMPRIGVYAVHDIAVRNDIETNVVRTCSLMNAVFLIVFVLPTDMTSW